MPDPLDESPFSQSMMSGPPTAFVVVFVLIALTVVTIITLAVVRGVRGWRRDNAAPVQTQVARVVAKRTDVSGGGGDRRTRTGYFATFETPTGERVELSVPGREFGLLAEGDVGSLTSQGRRFHGFARTSIASQ